jgi:ribosomal protein S27AE
VPLEVDLTEPHDICPRCGAELPPSIADGIGAGDTGNGLRKVEHEERNCPSCGIELKRAVGGAWFLASETELE